MLYKDAAAGHVDGQVFDSFGVVAGGLEGARFNNNNNGNNTNNNGYGGGDGGGGDGWGGGGGGGGGGAGGDGFHGGSPLASVDGGAARDGDIVEKGTPRRSSYYLGGDGGGGGGVGAGGDAAGTDEAGGVDDPVMMLTGSKMAADQVRI